MASARCAALLALVLQQRLLAQPVADEWAALHDGVLSEVLAREGLAPPPPPRPPSRVAVAAAAAAAASAAATVVSASASAPPAAAGAAAAASAAPRDPAAARELPLSGEQLRRHAGPLRNWPPEGTVSPRSDAAMVAAAAAGSEMLPGAVAAPLAELHSKIGAGAFGCVYTATWQSVSVAIKVFPSFSLAAGRSPAPAVHISRSHMLFGGAGAPATAPPAAAATTAPAPTPPGATAGAGGGGAAGADADSFHMFPLPPSLAAPGGGGGAPVVVHAAPRPYAPPGGQQRMPAMLQGWDEQAAAAARWQSVRDAFELASLRVVSHPNIVQDFGCVRLLREDQDGPGSLEPPPGHAHRTQQPPHHHHHHHPLQQQQQQQQHHQQPTASPLALLAQPQPGPPGPLPPSGGGAVESVGGPHSYGGGGDGGGGGGGRPQSYGDCGGGGLVFDGGSFVGSVHYMAPELLRRERRCTAAVDVYSLGVLMWELVADGAQPYAQGLSRRLPASLLEGICAGLRPAFGDSAVHWAIDELKATVPIWKKEFFEDGSCWKENEESRRLLTGAAAPAKP
ncbi:Molybdopterin synthase catalytic subunit [Tetrabaena socialis]|uniref:Molybdopterin synthase catalytic subunit n=1 Tax=Tetrabaena socialis TaxID=47790 RepID=A0A2J7ZUD0_9CHLO|nr:Molybdopterin synthase catalytic subunit [Tetrabaena socialis]|eukprot:PNH03874.1 Molybdopterin synthase catalytic subunit [Tetrabaena socialis]